jgi:hypothetical protein
MFSRCAKCRYLKEVGLTPFSKGEECQIKDKIINHRAMIRVCWLSKKKEDEK